MTDAFFVPEDDSVFRPTDLTIGPWGRDAQHGGPPAALLGRAIALRAGPEKQIARITFDILRPVPLEQVTVSSTVVRPGKKVSLIEARLDVAGETVMRAAGWAMRIADLDVPEMLREAQQTSPDDLEPMDPSMVTEPVSYLHATEWRFVSGGFLEPGPAVAWLRTRVPLVAGEEDTPLTKVLAVADSASGVSGALDFHSWIYINTDLSVYLHRPPRGEWIKLDAVTTPEPNGTALTSARLHDAHGPIGTSSQALFIAPR